MTQRKTHYKFRDQPMCGAPSRIAGTREMAYMDDNWGMVNCKNCHRVKFTKRRKPLKPEQERH